MSQPLDERTADALLAGRAVPGEPALSALVAEALALMEQPAPAPSPALAELLEHGLVPDTMLLPTLPTALPRRWLLPVPLAVGSILVAGGLFGAATANALPAPAQRIVSDTVGTLTPLHLPKPANKPKPTVTPTPAAVPSEDPNHQPFVPVQRSARPATDDRQGDEDQDGRSRGSGMTEHSDDPQEPGDDDGHDDGHDDTRDDTQQSHERTDRHDGGDERG